MSSIKDTDHIIVLDEGRIVQQGDHERLKKSEGLYNQLYAKQKKESEKKESEE